MKVRIGVGFGSVPGDAFPALVDRLAKLDVDSLWLSEQLSTDAVEPMTGMAFALARTERLKLGTGVVVLPGRNPVIFAKELATLAALAPRRVLPAVGLGPARKSERDAFPVPAGQRGAVFDEALTIVRRLLVEPKVTFHGEFFDFEEIGIGARPAYPVDIWLGGRVPAALRRVGRFGDGWLASQVTVAEAAAGIEAINAAATEASRAVDQDHFGLSLQIALDELPPERVSAMRARRPEVDPAELMPVGWPAIRRKIGEYVSVGVSKFVLYPAVGPSGWDPFLNAYADEVAPLQT